MSSNGRFVIIDKGNTIGYGISITRNRNEESVIFFFVTSTRMRKIASEK